MRSFSCHAEIEGRYSMLIASSASHAVLIALLG
jgi:hypothetical protein